MLNCPARISVIIPALNEECFIGECLASLAQVDYPRGAWEVIVVDNGSQDQTVDIARSFAGALEIRVYIEPSLLVTGLRNFGARMAEGERLVFLDADCVVRQDWLWRSVEERDRTKGDLLGATFQLPQTAAWVARAWWEYEQRNRGSSLSYLSAHNLHIDRERFLAMGGFDETLDTNEDFEFSQRLRESGGTLVDCPALSVVHLGNAETLWNFFRRERWHGRDVFQVFLRDVRKRHNFRAVAFAVYTAACIVSLGAGLAGLALWGVWRAAAVSAAALVGAAGLLGIAAAKRINRPRRAPALTLLFLVYGLARAAALLDRRGDSQRKFAKVATS